MSSMCDACGRSYEDGEEYFVIEGTSICEDCLDDYKYFYDEAESKEQAYDSHIDFLIDQMIERGCGIA